MSDEAFPCEVFDPTDAVRAKVGHSKELINLYFASYPRGQKEKFYAYMTPETAKQFALSILDKVDAHE